MRFYVGLSELQQRSSWGGELGQTSFGQILAGGYFSAFCMADLLPSFLKASSNTSVYTSLTGKDYNMTTCA